MPLQVGSIVEGVVTGITNFGAFVALPEGKTGLVHISEIADAYVRDIKDYVKENDRVKVKVLSLDEKGKIALSIRQAQPGAGTQRKPAEFRRMDRLSFEDKLSRYMKESDERLQDLKKSTDSKRGGRGAGRRNA
ncbi:MAG: S1 RNA-binding domain-containing protein [Firmicutes bacterium]|nr:S1 RNA-binding domain-containing protein [Bacillota bacterium]MCL5040223.1 S1 RNA-binding domain-containing protein [Bacillota bacterium]